MVAMAKYLHQKACDMPSNVLKLSHTTVTIGLHCTVVLLVTTTTLQINIPRSLNHRP